jgi:putative Holliday junction resolvase
MRYVGIDYGDKKVGIALGSEGGTMAFPETVLKNDPTLFAMVRALAKEYGDRVVIGDSRANDGSENPIAKEARAFGTRLEADGVTVAYEPEFYTSREAERIQGRNSMSDASAAAIMLTSYLRRTTR